MARICENCVQLLKPENSIAHKPDGEPVPFCRCTRCGATYHDTDPDGANPVKGGILWVCTAETPQGTCNTVLPTSDYSDDDLYNSVRFHCPACRHVWCIEEWVLGEEDIETARRVAYFAEGVHGPF